MYPLGTWADAAPRGDASTTPSGWWISDAADLRSVQASPHPGEKDGARDGVRSGDLPHRERCKHRLDDDDEDDEDVMGRC